MSVPLVFLMLALFFLGGISVSFVAMTRDTPEPARLHIGADEAATLPASATRPAEPRVVSDIERRENEALFLTRKHEVPDWIVRMLSGPTPAEQAETARLELMKRDAQREFEAEQEELRRAAEVADAGEDVVEYPKEEPEQEPREETWSMNWVLHWLKDHQHSDGYWCPRDYRQDSSRTLASATGNLPIGGLVVSDTGSASARVEATALALMTFTGQGHDHRDGGFKTACRKAILWLRSQMSPDGCVGTADRPRVREQAFAAMALSEAYGLSGDVALQEPSRIAMRYLLRMRRPDSGWAETTEGEPNCLSTALALFAIKTALMAGVEMAWHEPGDEATAFLDEMVVSEGDARFRIRFSRVLAELPAPEGEQAIVRLPLLEAAYVVSMLGLGKADLNSPRIKYFASVLARPENIPTLEMGKVQHLYWWFGTAALCWTGGASWKSWQSPLEIVVGDSIRGHIAHDRTCGTTAATLDEHGSWDSGSGHAASLGRVGSTALSALTMDTLHRYQQWAHRLKDD